MQAIGPQQGSIENSQLSDQSVARQYTSGSIKSIEGNAMASPSNAAYMKAVVPVTRVSEADIVTGHLQNLLQTAFGKLKNNDGWFLRGKLLTTQQRFEFHQDDFQAGFADNITKFNAVLSTTRLSSSTQERAQHLAAIVCKATSAFLAAISVSNMNERLLRLHCLSAGIRLLRMNNMSPYGKLFSSTLLRMKSLSSPLGLHDFYYESKHEHDLRKIPAGIKPVFEACKKIIKDSENNGNLKTDLKDPEYGRLLSAKLLLNGITGGQYAEQGLKNLTISTGGAGSKTFNVMLYAELSKAMQSVSQMIHKAFSADTFDETQFTNTITQYLNDYARDYNTFMQAFFRIPPDFMQELIKFERIAQNYLSRSGEFITYPQLEPAAAANPDDLFLTLDLMAERLDAFEHVIRSDKDKYNDVRRELIKLDKQEFPELYRNGSRRSIKMNHDFELPYEFLDTLCFKRDSPEKLNEYDYIARQLAEDWKIGISQDAAVQLPKYDETKALWNGYHNDYENLRVERINRAGSYIKKWFTAEPMTLGEFSARTKKPPRPEHPVIGATKPASRIEEVTGPEPDIDTSKSIPNTLKLITAGESTEATAFEEPTKETAIIEDISDLENESVRNLSQYQEPVIPAIEPQPAAVSSTEIVQTPSSVKTEETVTQNTENNARKRLTKSRPVSIQKPVPTPELLEETTEKREPNKLKKKESKDSAIELAPQVQQPNPKPLADMIRELRQDNSARSSSITTASEASDLFNRSSELLNSNVEPVNTYMQARAESVSDYEDEPVIQHQEDDYRRHLEPSRTSLVSSLRPQKSTVSRPLSHTSAISDSASDEHDLLLDETQSQTAKSVRPSLEIIGKAKTPSSRSQSMFSDSMKQKPTWASRLGSIAAFFVSLPQRIYSFFSMTQKPSVPENESLLTQSSNRSNPDFESDNLIADSNQDDFEEHEEITNRISETEPLNSDHKNLIHVIDFAKVTPLDSSDDFSSYLLGEFERRLSALRTQPF